MKKIIILCFLLSFVFTLSSCTLLDSQKKNQNNQSAPVADNTNEVLPEPPVKEPTEAEKQQELEKKIFSELEGMNRDFGIEGLEDELLYDLDLPSPYDKLDFGNRDYPELLKQYCLSAEQFIKIVKTAYDNDQAQFSKWLIDAWSANDFKEIRQGVSYRWEKFSAYGQQFEVCLNHSQQLVNNQPTFKITENSKTIVEFDIYDNLAATQSRLALGDYYIRKINGTVYVLVKLPVAGKDQAMDDFLNSFKLATELVFPNFAAKPIIGDEKYFVAEFNRLTDNKIEEVVQVRKYDSSNDTYESIYEMTGENLLAKNYILSNVISDRIFELSSSGAYYDYFVVNALYYDAMTKRLVDFNNTELYRPVFVQNDILYFLTSDHLSAEAKSYDSAYKINALKALDLSAEKFDQHNVYISGLGLINYLGQDNDRLHLREIVIDPAILTATNINRSQVSEVLAYKQKVNDIYITPLQDNKYNTEILSK